MKAILCILAGAMMAAGAMAQTPSRALTIGTNGQPNTTGFHFDLSGSYVQGQNVSLLETGYGIQVHGQIDPGIGPEGIIRLNNNGSLIDMLTIQYRDFTGAGNAAGRVMVNAADFGHASGNWKFYPNGSMTLAGDVSAYSFAGIGDSLLFNATGYSLTPLLGSDSILFDSYGIANMAHFSEQASTDVDGHDLSNLFNSLGQAQAVTDVDGNILSTLFDGTGGDVYFAQSAQGAYFANNTFDDFFHPGGAGFNTDVSLPGDGTVSFANGGFILDAAGNITSDSDISAVTASGSGFGPTPVFNNPEGYYFNSDGVAWQSSYSQIAQSAVIGLNDFFFPAAGAQLPSTSPAPGLGALWYDPADGNRVKYAP